MNVEIALVIKLILILMPLIQTSLMNLIQIPSDMKSRAAMFLSLLTNLQASNVHILLKINVGTLKVSNSKYDIKVSNRSTN